MIVVKLMGGLGNQMFQYAYALSLSKEYNEEILFDTSFYPNEQKLVLYNFCVPHHTSWIKKISTAERAKVINAQRMYRLLQKIKRTLLRTEELGSNWFYKNIQKGYYFNFDPYYYLFHRSEQKNKYIYGYFQSEKYFHNCSDLIRKEFRLLSSISKKAEKLKQEIQRVNSVALHIRLGDYKKLKNFYLKVCTNQYYKRAIEYIFENVDSPQIYIFTDDEKALEEVIDMQSNFYIVQGMKDYEDFELIRSCHHAILSNSSFSWWAVYLNQNDDMKIVVPTPWFTTLKNARVPDIYTPNMHLIECYTKR